MGIACPATVWILVGTGWCGRGNLGWPSRERSPSGQGSVTQASKLEPDNDLLEILKGMVIRALGAGRSVR